VAWWGWWPQVFDPPPSSGVGVEAAVVGAAEGDAVSGGEVVGFEVGGGGAAVAVGGEVLAAVPGPVEDVGAEACLGGAVAGVASVVAWGVRRVAQHEC
jgi:hypothetical protein